MGPDAHQCRRLLADRFWEKVEKTETCWLWRGSRNGDGYGTFWRSAAAGVDGAHKVAYELLVEFVPDGLELDHLCRNRACVNPAHLEPIPHRENTRRGNGWAGRNGRSTHPASSDRRDEWRHNISAGLRRAYRAKERIHAAAVGSTT